MYSPEDIKKARREAGFHLEVCIEKAQATPTQPGQAQVQGRVTQVFFAKEPIHKGHLVSFWVDSRYCGQRSPPGDDVRLDLEDILTARYAEAFFYAAGLDSGPPSQLQIALRQVALFNESSPVGRL